MPHCRWIYHAMATHQDLKQNTEKNIFSGSWLVPVLSSDIILFVYLYLPVPVPICYLSCPRWFWIFWYFERNVPVNLPRQYSLPIPRYQQHDHYHILFLLLNHSQFSASITTTATTSPQHHHHITTTTSPPPPPSPLPL